MKILFCKEYFSSGLPWEGLASLLPDHEITSCRREEIAAHLDGVDILVPTMASVSRDLIQQGQFSLIHQFGVGLEKVDIEAATAAGIWVARLPAAGTGNAVSVAEHAILLMLALSRQLDKARENVGSGQWGQPPGLGLFGKTACIVGLGDIGTELAKRLTAFGMRLIGVRNNPERGAPADTHMQAVYGADKLHDALSEADYVVVCVNYGKHNHHLLDSAAIQSMKHGSFFVNIARGGLVDHDALLSALESGQVAGAGLDVFWQEPVDPTHPIFRQNVIATPHIAGITDLFYHNGGHFFAENIARYVSGRPLQNSVNTPATPRHPLRSLSSKH